VSEIVPKAVLETIAPWRYPSKRYEHPGPVVVEAVLGACLVVRRTVLDEVGLMPEDYFMFLEETDWCWRIRRAGYKVVHLPDDQDIGFSVDPFARRMLLDGTDEIGWLLARTVAIDAWEATHPARVDTRPVGPA